MIGLVTTSSKGLISAPKTAQLKHKAANIQFAPFQSYWSSKKLASGAKTKVPTPLPQTAMPRNEIESVLKISNKKKENTFIKLDLQISAELTNEL